MKTRLTIQRAEAGVSVISRLKSAEARLANWKRHLAVISLVIMLFGSVSSAFLSWQDISGYLWAEIFHQQKPGGPHAA
ncbi:hypothetical protein [Acetobacter sp. DmW_043]|uniref:hypothetical protein n=1 Tax=Acetobacter sp. DmW_043 TaxID=1670658 RepID=UPI0011773F7D|nr:hypothetical protein [Acetobacter sp. DmW_043]